MAQESAVIASLRRDVPTALVELATLGRTLSRRAGDVLAYFDQPGTSNGPTEAINGRLEHLRGTLDRPNVADGPVGELRGPVLAATSSPATCRWTPTDIRGWPTVR